MVSIRDLKHIKLAYDVSIQNILSTWKTLQKVVLLIMFSCAGVCKGWHLYAGL